jgi:DNA processing protein
MPASDRANGDMNPTDEASASVSESASAALVIAEQPGEWAPSAVSYVAPEQLPESASAFDDPELAYWVALNRVKGIGPARFRALLEAFGSAEAAWHGTLADWLVAGLDTRTAHSFDEQRRRIVPEAEVERLVRLRVSALRLTDAGYPRLLREAPMPPPVLYLRGAITAEDEWAVAVVGTRRATTYGRQITERLAGELAAQRITIVSGLARGIDTHAHTAALEAGGRTIAVLGCGPDLVYPPENARLAARIVESGAVVTEFAPGTQPDAGNFPARNRLISGLSLGVLVTEAPVDSGALITTRFAAQQGRDVFAVPGNVTSRGSAGANRLIQDGAKLVLEVNDILTELNLHMVPQQMELRELLPETDAEALILAQLDPAGEPRHIDEICRATGLPVAEVSGTLIMLELKGQTSLVGPMTYARAR